jgi:hypothetical protein
MGLMDLPTLSNFRPVACFPPNRAAARLLFLPLLTVFAVILFSACSQATPAPLSIFPTRPALFSGVHPLSTPQPTFYTPLSTPSSIQCPLYNLDVQLDYATHFLRIDETIIYPNQTGETLSELVLAVVPNDWPGFMLISLRVDGVDSPAHTLSGEQLTVPLSTSLKPEEQVTLSIAYDVSLPPIAASSAAQVRPQVYGYSPRQINLIDWYPFIVPYEAGQGWLLHPPTAFGEYLAYDVADFDVLLRFPDPNSIPVIAASGAEQPAPESSSRRYHLERGRAFAVSASPAFQVTSQVVDGITVSSYYFPEDTAAGQAVLAVSSQALQIYIDRFGPPQHMTLAAVQGDFEDGMEASAFYWLGQGYYDHYDGTPKNYLTIISAHETSHQWWFERVGNDQMLAPWLDESLAAYSERVYYETAHPDLLNWWWDYRINRYSPAGWVDMAVTDAPYYEAYRKAVYLNGAKFMESLRRRLGDESFFACLRAYATQMTSRRATTDDFFSVLRQQADIDVSDLRAAYFKSR